MEVADAGDGTVGDVDMILLGVDSGLADETADDVDDDVELPLPPGVGRSNSPSPCTRCTNCRAFIGLRNLPYARTPA